MPGTLTTPSYFPFSGLWAPATSQGPQDRGRSSAQGAGLSWQDQTQPQFPSWPSPRILLGSISAQASIAPLLPSDQSALASMLLCPFGDPKAIPSLLPGYDQD